MTSVSDSKVILGLRICQMFNLVSVNCDDKCPCKQISLVVINNEFLRGLEIPDSTNMEQMKLPPVDINTKLRSNDMKAHIMELFHKLFDGIGLIKGAIVNLDVNPDAVPVVQPPRKGPQAMIEPLKTELNRMEQLGVIKKLDINEATDWCHNLVLVHKPNGKLRVCLSPHTINTAVRFNVHNSKTFQDMTSNIRRVKKVSKIDANSGFWTLPMDIRSQLLTTFNIPWGRYCFIKMPFGLNQSQYFFQYYMDLHFDSINETTNVIADDVMIYRETDQQHDKYLIHVLNKCPEIGLKLNTEKCMFGAENVQFYGNTGGCQGLQPDPKKVDVIMRMPAPMSKT